jgi:23S rRNA pseudouridine1911/1915/1917 synthase
LTDNKNYKKTDIELTVKEPSGLLDYLLVNVKGKSRNNIKSLLTHKEVLVDGRIVTRHDYMLKPGQGIRIVHSISREQSRQRLPQLIYEDEELIVIEKPAGLLTMSADRTNENEVTAYKLINEYVRQTGQRSRIFIVHRLDRETSGVLIFAKNEKLKAALQDNWDSLVTLRSYKAVVEGQLREKKGRIRSWLKETKTLLVYSSKVEGEGLEAITDYQVLMEGPLYSLLDVQLQTGRKNQIRVHMKELGHPIVGDKKYGSKSELIERLALHSDKLELKHPVTGKLMLFSAETPKEFFSLIRKAGQQ